jgi:hypothetical protein
MHSHTRSFTVADNYTNLKQRTRMEDPAHLGRCTSRKGWVALGSVVCRSKGTRPSAASPSRRATLRAPDPGASLPAGISCGVVASCTSLAAAAPEAGDATNRRQQATNGRHMFRCNFGLRITINGCILDTTRTEALVSTETTSMSWRAQAETTTALLPSEGGTQGGQPA